MADGQKWNDADIGDRCVPCRAAPFVAPMRSPVVAPNFHSLQEVIMNSEDDAIPSKCQA